MTTFSRPLQMAVAGFLALVVLAVGIPSAGADAGSEARFVELINQARSSQGRGSLITNAELTSIARRWSQRMADNQKLSHNPNLANEVTQDWEKLAENVGFGQDVDQIHQAFMNSAAHRANILDGTLTHVGVGVVVDGSGQIWVTEVFMRVRGGGSGSTPPPTTAAPPPTTAAPASAPTAPPPTSPPTTRAPRVTTPTTARPVPTPTAPPVTAAPPPAPTPEELAAAAAAAAARAASAGPAPLRTPTMRLVLVLDGLSALDRGR